MSDSEKKHIFIKELARISNHTPTKIKEWIKEIHHHDWSSDPSFLGAYSYPKVHQGKKAKIITSFDKTLFFAGEAFSTEMSGTVEGALKTGKSAAHKIIDSMKTGQIPINRATLHSDVSTLRVKSL